MKIIKVNVTILNSPFIGVPPDKGGGIELYTLYLVKSLIREFKSVEINYITRVKDLKKLVNFIGYDYIERVRIIKIPGKELISVDNYVHLITHIKRIVREVYNTINKHYNLIKDSNPIHYNELIGGCLLKKILGDYSSITEMITVHNFPSLYYLKNWEIFPKTYSLKKTLIIPIEQVFLKQIPNIVIINPDMKKFLMRYNNTANYFYIPNGVDIEKFSPTVKMRPENEKILRTYKLLKIAGDYILFVGRVEPVKGINILLHAYVKSRIKNPLVIVGSGSYDAHVIKFIKKYNLKDRIYFLGSVNWNHLPYIYANAHSFVLPSLSEGFPTALLEALASGLPVIVTDAVKKLGIVETNYNGFIIKKSDLHELINALLYLTTSDTVRKKMSIRARKVIEKKFSWNVIARRIYDLYTRLIAK